MPRTKKKTTPKLKTVALDTALLPFTDSRDFQVVSVDLEMPVYAVLNKRTAHCELMFSQLSQAVLNMQTAQQTLDRVRTGEANGYVDYGTASQG